MNLENQEIQTPNQKNNLDESKSDINHKSFHSHNKWRDEKGRSTSYSIRSMVITAILLALYIIFCYVGNTFFHLTFLANFLNLDFSLVFLIILVFICKWQWWLFAGIVGGLANFLWAGVGGYVGVIFNIILNLTTLSFVFLMKHFFIERCVSNNKLNQVTNTVNDSLNHKKKSFKKIHGIELRILTICVITFIYSIILNCLLNGILFTPLYMQLYHMTQSAWFIETAKEYNANPNALLLFIPDYWTGIFTLYSAFNAIKFGLVLSLSFVLLVLRYKTNIVDNYFLS